MPTTSTSATPKATPRKRKAVKRTCRWVTRKVKVKGRTRKRKVKVCTPVKAKRTAAKRPTPPPPRPAPAPSPAGVIGQAAPLVPVTAPAAPPAPSPAPVPARAAPLDAARVERLLWRAGFGPEPGLARRLTGMDPEEAVRVLTRPAGAAVLHGPEPADDAGRPLAPDDSWGHDHLAWLDRMVRGDQPLVERMALVWHDWFATSNDGVGSQKLVRDQIQLFRDKGLGSFDELFTAVTCDPAMLLWLNGSLSTKWNPNENYAREMMELFSLGADRGAYTERDVRELARSLTGWRHDWSPELGSHAFRFDANWHDAGSKTVFGRTGAFTWTDAVQLCVTHPLHASFFCTKLWSYFVPTPPDAATLARLQGTYLDSGRQILPVLEAILLHPDLHDGPDMVIPPVVATAQLLRTVGRGVRGTAWAWLGSLAGQRLGYPPDVSGWDDTRWLDTSTIRARWMLAHYALQPVAVNPWASPGYDVAEEPDVAVAKALEALGTPALGAETRAVLARFAATCLPATTPSWGRGPYRAMRQNALRMLIATAPDTQVS